MKVGVEMCHGFIEDLGYDDYVSAFDRVKAFGFAGMSYKSPQYISKKLDPDRLRSARQYADDLGLYLEFGLGRVNPYNTSEAPDVWLLGGGDYCLALEKLIAAAAEIGCHELVGVTAGWKYNHTGYFHFDRYRTDVSWEDQLAATTKFLRKMAPILRQYGSRVNLETHEEITSFEIIRIIEAVGADVVGVCFDTGNILSRGEDPVASARRVAPYCHQTHGKDGILFFSENGVVRQVKPCGSAVNLRTMLERKLQPDGWCDAEPQYNLMNIFDVLIHNTDRTQENALFTRDWTLVLIDHSLAFRTHLKRPRLLYLGELQLPPALAERLAALDAAQLQQALSPWLHKRQIDAILKRRDQLLREYRARTAAGQRATGT